MSLKNTGIHNPGNSSLACEGFGFKYLLVLDVCEMETRQMVHGFPVSSGNETPSVVQMTGILAEHETSVKNPSRKDLTESTMEALNRLAAIEVVRSHSCHLPHSSYLGKTPC